MRRAFAALALILLFAAPLALPAAAQELSNEEIAAIKNAVFNDPEAPVMGNPQGDVVLVEFTDYNCGFCRKTMPEVRALLQLALSPELPVLRALGVGPLARLIAGEASPAEAGEAAKAETRQYAKRQLTWLRRNMNAWKWINAQEMESFVATLSDFIKSKA